LELGSPLISQFLGLVQGVIGFCGFAKRIEGKALY
jgi:hypothetical protein